MTGWRQFHLLCTNLGLVDIYMKVRLSAWPPSMVLVSYYEIHNVLGWASDCFIKLQKISKPRILLGGIINDHGCIAIITS